MAADDNMIVAQIADDDDNFPADAWRNVIQNTWLMITGMNMIDTASGKSMIVYLKNRNGTLVKA